MKLVRELKIGDEVIFVNGGSSCAVVVKEIKKDRVLVSKPFGHCLMGISFFNHNSEDLQNRVQEI